MANESTTGGPLTATVGEQLAGKGHAEGVQEAQRAAGARGEPGGLLHAGPEVEAPAGAAEERRVRRRQARGRASRVPWGAVLAAGAGWVLAKTIARGLRRR